MRKQAFELKDFAGLVDKGINHIKDNWGAYGGAAVGATALGGLGALLGGRKAGLLGALLGLIGGGYGGYRLQNRQAASAPGPAQAPMTVKELKRLVPAPVSSSLDPTRFLPKADQPLQLQSDESWRRQRDGLWKLYRQPNTPLQTGPRVLESPKMPKTPGVSYVQRQLIEQQRNPGTASV